jgi:hypothetical protein
MPVKLAVSLCTTSGAARSGKFLFVFVRPTPSSSQMILAERNMSWKGLVSDRKRSVGVVGRFTDTGRYLIITVYEITHE